MMSDSEQLWPAAPPREGFLLLYQLLYIFIHICAPDGNSYIHTCDIFLVVKKWKRSSTQYSFFFYYHGNNSVRNMCAKILHLASVLWSVFWIVQREKKKEHMQGWFQSSELSLRWCWIDKRIHHCLPLILQGCGNLYFYPDLTNYTVLPHCDH